MHLGHRIRTLAPAGLIALFVSIPGGSACRADFVGLGQAGQYALLGINTKFSFNGPGLITGDVGLTSGSSYNLASPAAVNGTFFADAGVSGSNSGVTFSGGTVVTSLAQAVTDAQNAAASAAAQSATGTLPGNAINVTNPSQSVILNGVAGQNVVDLTGISLNNGNFTINGPSNATFIVNVAGDITVNGGSNILLSGGVTADRVLFNVTGTGNKVTFTGSGALAGTFLDLNGSFSVHDKTLAGALIGGSGQSIADTSGFKIVLPTPAVPEPSSVVLLGLGAVAGLARVARRRPRA